MLDVQEKGIKAPSLQGREAQKGLVQTGGSLYADGFLNGPQRDVCQAPRPITVVPELPGWVCSAWTWIYMPTARQSAVQPGVRCLQGELDAVLSQDACFSVCFQRRVVSFT